MFHIRGGVLFLFLGLCLLLPVVGCGGSGVTVTGQVTKGGSPYQLSEGEKMILMLRGGEGHLYSGDVQQDGSFRVTGEKGGGIPAMTYDVSVTHYPPTIKSPPQPVETGEKWAVSPSQTNFTLDVSKLKTVR